MILIGLDSSEMAKIVGDIQPSYDAYLYDKVEQIIKIYYLNEDGKLLSVFDRG